MNHVIPFTQRDVELPSPAQRWTNYRRQLSPNVCEDPDYFPIETWRHTGEQFPRDYPQYAYNKLRTFLRSAFGLALLSWVGIAVAVRWL